MKKITRWIIKIVIYAIAIGYLLFPLDFIPDAPTIGLIDDAVLIILAIMINSLIDFMRKK